MTERRTTTLYLAALLFVSLCCSKKKPPARSPVPIEHAHAAYVTDNGSDEISVIDRDSERVVSVSLDIDPDAHEAPHHLAVRSGDDKVFVALAFPPEKQAPGKHSGHGRATQNGALLTLDLTTLGVRESHDTEENPGDVVLTHDGTRVLVTHFDMQRAMQQAAAGAIPSKMSAALQVWDEATGVLISTRPICVAPHGVVTTHDDSLAVIACYGSDEIAFVDLHSADLATARVPVGGMPGLLGAPRYGPYAVALSADDVVGVVADLESGDVRTFDVPTRTMKPDSVLVLGGHAMMPAFVAPRIVLVPTQGPDGLARVNVAENRLEKRVNYTDAECKSPHVTRVAKDARVYVVCEGDHVTSGAVLEIDPITLATRKRWVVGVFPDGIAFGDD